MKITAFFLTVICLHAAAGGHTQTITISVKNAPLEKIFGEIKKQTGYEFVYRWELLQNTRPVDLEVKNEPIKQVLDICFKDQRLSYNIMDNLIVLSEKIEQKDIGHPSPLLIDVTGKVTDTSGNPLAGAYIKVKGANNSTITNESGEFILKGVDENAILIITSVSHETQEIKLNGRNEIVVQLKTKVTELSAVAVTVNTGYQEIAKERVTGSFTKIDNSLFHREVSTDLLSRLEGITNSLLFDKRSSAIGRLQVRGVSSINSNPNPLIILDNFPYVGDINNINPNDVADVTILKDAAAASIWGAKAGNGVIVITTKKGKYNQPLRVSINSNITFQEKPDLFYFPIISNSDFIDVEQFLFSKGFYTADLANTTTRPVISPVIEILSKQAAGIITASDATSQINLLRGIDVRNDYEKYVFRKSVNQQNYLNLSGGANTIQYLFSFGYDHNLSSIDGPGGYDRYTINSNTTFKPLKYLEINAGINFSQGTSKADGIIYPISPGNNKSQLYPYAQLADGQGNHLAVPFAYRMSYIDTAGGGKLLDWHYRPLDEMKFVNNYTRNQFYLVNLSTNLSFTPWLNGEIKYQYTQQTGYNPNLQNQQTFFTRNLINRFTQINGNTITRRIPLGSILDITNGESSSQNFRGQLNINKKWESHHEVTGLIAGEFSKAKSNSARTRLYGYNDDILTFVPSIDYATSFPIYGALSGSSQIPNSIIFSNGTLTNLVSILANASYSYKNRYNFYASARRDGSNLYGVKANNKWKPLWATGVSWDVSKENFYKINWAPYLRLRLSYGYLGNTNNTISGLPTITYAGRNLYTNAPLAVPGNPPNPDLRWEQVKTLNIGVDLSIFQNRIYSTLEWFNKKSEDLIAPIPLDPTSGLTSYSINYASLKSNGIDISFHSKNTTGLIKWETNLELSYIRTIVTKYNRSNYNSSGFITGTPAISPIVGKLAYPIFSYRWAGLDPATGDPQGYLNGAVSKNYIAISNDSIQNQIYHGSAFPLTFGNIMNSFSWKGFTLSGNIIYKLNYYFRNPATSYSGLFNNWLNGYTDFEQRWQKPGDENITNVPSMAYPANSARDGFYVYSEVNVEKGDNIRLQDVRLSFNWDNKNFRHFPIKNAQFYFILSNINLFIWRASKSGLDPDYPTNFLPPTKSWAVGINVNL